VTITNDSVTWREGGLLEVDGKLLGLGFQLYTLMRSKGGGAFFASQIYRASGVVMEEAVDGFSGVEQFYGPFG
jgi:hypothetical protein